MQNPLVITLTKFEDLGSGDALFGFRARDKYDLLFIDNYRSATAFIQDYPDTDTLIEQVKQGFDSVHPHTSVEVIGFEQVKRTADEEAKPKGLDEALEALEMDPDLGLYAVNVGEVDLVSAPRDVFNPQEVIVAAESPTGALLLGERWFQENIPHVTTLRFTATGAAREVAPEDYQRWMPEGMLEVLHENMDSGMEPS